MRPKAEPWRGVRRARKTIRWVRRARKTGQWPVFTDERAGRPWVVFTDERAGRPWHGSGTKDMRRGSSRGNTLDRNPQRRYVRREDEIAQRFLPYRFAVWVRSARKTGRWPVFSENRPAGPGPLAPEGTTGKSAGGFRRGDASPPCGDCSVLLNSHHYYSRRQRSPAVFENGGLYAF